MLISKGTSNQQHEHKYIGIEKNIKEKKEERKKGKERRRRKK